MLREGPRTPEGCDRIISIPSKRGSGVPRSGNVRCALAHGVFQSPLSGAVLRVRVMRAMGASKILGSGYS